jgi:UDP-2-acetamido-3-amino-2,3-dideoxy-glucuronate N-acetyltransferase
LTAQAPRATVHPSAEVAQDAVLGDGSVVWSLAQIRERAVIGRDCIIGRGSYVDHDVTIGDDVKIQNLAQVYFPAEVSRGVFIGPSAVFTNDQYPRAVTPSGERATSDDWRPVGVSVREGASIGAHAVCVAPVVIGRWAMVAAGAVVTRNVPDFALVAGTPARLVGWVGRAGRRLVEDSEGWACPVTGTRYVEKDGVIEEAGR